MKKKCLQYQEAKCFLINEKCFIHIKTKRKLSDFLKLLKTGCIKNVREEMIKEKKRIQMKL